MTSRLQIAALGERTGTLEGGLKAQSKSVDDQQLQIAALAQDTNTLEEWANDHGNRVEKLTGKTGELEKTTKNIRNRLDDLEDSVSTLSGKVDILDVRTAPPSSRSGTNEVRSDEETRPGHEGSVPGSGENGDLGYSVGTQDPNRDPPPIDGTPPDEYERGSAPDDSAKDFGSSLTSEEIKKIQEALISLGYNPGIADGLMGENTSNAIEEWQASSGLEPTGTIDREQMKKLLDSVDENKSQR